MSPNLNVWFFYCCDIENLGKVTKIYSVLCYVPIMSPWKFGKNQTTGSHDVVQTRKFHADADVDANANAIRTKINMSPST